MSEYCEKDELTFLGDLSGLADYKAVSNLCLNCCQNGIDKEVAVGISAHGYFCAAIIASRNIANVEVGGISLGTVRGVSPPPRIALYAVGCPSCLKMTEDNMSEGIRAAIQQKVKVISMSLAREFPAHYYEDSPNFHERDSATLTALNADILTIVSAGNLGEYGLRTVAKTAPWCLTVASCTPRRKFHTVLSFHLPLSKPKTFDIEVESMNIMECDWTVLRNNGKISGSQCLLFYDGKANHVVIEASKTVTEAPSLIPVVSIPVKDSLIIAEALAQAHTENKEEDLYVKITCSVKKDVINSPLVSTFSGRGPCSFFQEFMKPEICAPGEEIAAAWPTSEPLGGFGPPTYSDFNVKRGTSFATPIVAAAVATLRAENKFSATASYSAIITSAKKMHGKERVAYEFAYGAGMLDLKRAMRPGLVYEESTERYQRWFSGGMSHLELNLPYFSATFPAGDSPWNCEFKRKVKSVEIGKCTYVAKVVVHKLSLQCASVSIKTTSNRLIFEEQGEEQEFSLLVRLPRTREKKDTFGLISASLIWQNEENEELVVVSPIILSSKNVPGPHITDELYKQLVDILVAIFCSTNYSIMS
ncbi:hypothetical protein RND81_04G045700 [Saponaria officinalis]|uniref:Uncharacterized protein n=1 Tax=Saponaria officinalis TaxID=3572 RepID=A0AAW1LIX0_SAPOF